MDKEKQNLRSSGSQDKLFYSVGLLVGICNIIFLFSFLFGCSQFIYLLKGGDTKMMEFKKIKEDFVEVISSGSKTTE